MIGKKTLFSATISMVLLNQGSTGEKIVLTLTEKVTLVAPFFLFIFTHVSTKQVVAFTKATAEDTTVSAARYNEFEVNTSVLFADKATGQWQYLVYETATDQTNPTGLNLLENGKMLLQKTTGTTLTGYDTKPTYTGYGG